MKRALSLLLLLGLAVAAAARPAAAGPEESCIKSWGEARFGALAYNHIVHIANACAPDAECTVSTDVNPEPQKVTVPGKSEIEVTTFMGSPARVFTPHVKCKMLGR